MLIKYYELVAESMLNSKTFEEGALYFCTDTGNIYLDSNASGRISIGNMIIIINTESERTDLLAPIPNKFYYVKKSSRIYIYNEGAWNEVNSTDATLTLSGVPADAKAVGDMFVSIETKARDCIILRDAINGYKYIVQMQNGTLVSFIKCTGIEITTLPNKIDYTYGDSVDLTGLVITGIRDDGNAFVVDSYECEEVVIDSSFKITYIEAGIEYSTYIDFNVTPFDPEIVLIDFEYVVEEDGTYTITAWKGTLNGEASTEMIIPNNSLINV